MKKILALVLIALSMPVCASPPENFESRVDSVLATAEVPGMAIAIVENGAVTLARGFGVRKLGSPEKVDGDTIFMTGSTGKAMTTAALATLVEAGKLKWDDPVSDHIPGFQMYDPWVTREMTVRDLLVHRSGLGLGAGDLLVIPRGTLSRAEVVRRLRFIKPARSFRSGYAYDNILYIVAGHVIDLVSGQPYEDYIREHLFRPAGMLHSTSDQAHRFATPNRASPHARIGGAVRGIGPLKVLDEHDNLAPSSTPAGLLAISANDLARWLQIQLAKGKLPEGGRLFSEASSNEMWAPQTIEPISPALPGLEETTPNFQQYALGWEVRDYGGAKIIWHSGGVFGFVTVVVLIPAKNVGFAITQNSEDGQARFGLMYELLDHYLGRPKKDWPARFTKVRKERFDAAVAALNTKAAAPVQSKPTLPLGQYAGRYVDAWYGAIAIGSDPTGLTINFTNTPNMGGRLQHWQYDTFIARFDDPGIEPAYVSFGLGAEGKVERITMKPVSPLADFSFDYQDLLFTPGT
ncbi:MAG TPA: serine hydrolase [Steroidobacteraceae bacterium]|jgi:CubicO group peptidase (beta-lactamase class C family)